MDQPTSRQHSRKLTIIAQDPAVENADGKILRSCVEVPMELLAPGPWGYRVQVIDYDASTEALFKPLEYQTKNGIPVDPYAKASDSVLINDPRFHAQNVYAITMRILARFEFALGRRVAWSFSGHQLKIAPHAFADANAFYSARDEALLFGYFPTRDGKGTVFSCLSHDVVAHETTHALLDGLRERYTDPSSPDQAAFHEGFSDVVALLSVFALKDVVTAGLTRLAKKLSTKPPKGLVPQSVLTADALRSSMLLAVAEEMGSELSAIRGEPLRRSATLVPSKTYVDDPEFLEPHRRGELLVAAMMNAFLAVWVDRLKPLGRIRGGYLDLERVAEEGARSADYLLTMAIRAIDYSTPVHMEFSDYLRALLTADLEIRPDEGGFPFRRRLRESFAAFKIGDTSDGKGAEPGVWYSPEQEDPDIELVYDTTHFESLKCDPTEVFRFVWENRGPLRLYEGAFTRVLSVRPCLRVGRDGFALHETVAEYIQILELRASELAALDIERPEGMPPETPVSLYGGGVLIFDEYGRVKFHIHNRLRRPERQTERLKHLWDYGYFNRGASAMRRFSHLHRMRALDARTHALQSW